MKNKNKYKSKATALIETAPLSEQEVKDKTKAEDEKFIFTGYPIYPVEEDIYSKEKRIELDPDETTQMREPQEQLGKNNEKDFSEDVSGDDLDVPGSELDDEQEKIGSEDEENNYYSLGGDDHDDLDEDKG